ncbi:MAG: amino acid-binding protein [Candidatus Methanoliparum thermophilum]|uniref:Amino acid-binding protein n=1 Tax=Methanoliparum thermophilum TaxID=2491083 RepID=A0A520KSR9_METT2|nr:hypothetical protein [Candidatus Methanoliparum sp. LAM-1]RZN64952.1 MAG: amino acid-binding protein [Candidatus Methanoliparum thermophilum]BDC36165.1 amino acid-binding protein [Candidatus Methanoliparum sp. LAM-1]
MKVKMKLELKDEPGTLIKALLPISKYGGNIVYVVHDREKKLPNGNITVQISIEANKDQVREIKNALEDEDIGILSIDEVKLIEDLAFIMIGHIVDTDIKDTIDRVDNTGFAEVIDLNLKMPNIKKESSARIIIRATGKEEMKKCVDLINKIANEKDFVLIYPLMLETQNERD